MKRFTRLRSLIIDLVARRIRISAFSFSEKSLDEYLKKLSRRNPDYFYGYSSMIYELALYADRVGGEGMINPKAVVVTSEVTTPSMKKAIEKCFKTRVFEEYGCGEVGTIAHECDKGGLHVNMENILIEIVDNKGMTVPDGEVGEVVVTDLSNNLMPLIRYKLKDFASINTEKCECGRSLIRLENIKGRAYDFVHNERGEKFHGEFFLYILEELKSSGVILKAAQFVRNEKGLKVMLSADERNYNKARSYISERLRMSFSESMNISFERVDQIPRERSGKLRVIKSEI